MDLGEFAASDVLVVHNAEQKNRDYMTLKNKLCILFIFLIHCCTGFWSKKSNYPKKKRFHENNTIKI
jgi:hypothetical protein